MFCIYLLLQHSRSCHVPETHKTRDLKCVLQVERDNRPVEDTSSNSYHDQPSVTGTTSSFEMDTLNKGLTTEDVILNSTRETLMGFFSNSKVSIQCSSAQLEAKSSPNETVQEQRWALMAHCKPQSCRIKSWLSSCSPQQNSH